MLGTCPVFQWGSDRLTKGIQSCSTLCVGSFGLSVPVPKKRRRFDNFGPENAFVRRIRNKVHSSYAQFFFVPFESENSHVVRLTAERPITRSRSNHTASAAPLHTPSTLISLSYPSNRPLHSFSSYPTPLLTTFTTYKHGTTSVRPTSSPDLLYWFASHSTSPFKPHHLTHLSVVLRLQNPRGTSR